MTLLDLPLGNDARIARLAHDETTAAYLRAVGIAEGIGVRVIRRAPFGGPLHVRTTSGADLALDRELAAGVEMEP